MCGMRYKQLILLFQLSSFLNAKIWHSMVWYDLIVKVKREGLFGHFTLSFTIALHLSAEGQPVVSSHMTNYCLVTYQQLQVEIKTLTTVSGLLPGGDSLKKLSVE